MTSWGRAGSWAVRMLLALTLAAGLAVVGVTGSGTAVAAASWWLPSSWVTAAVGAAVDAAQAMSGHGSVVTGQGAGVVEGAYPVLDNQFGLGKRHRVLVGGKLTWSAMDGVCWPGRVNNGLCPTDATAPAANTLVGTGGATIVCVNGQSIGSVGVNAGLPDAAWFCDSRGGYSSVTLSGSSGSGGWWYPPMVWRITPVTDQLVTAVTCRNLATGVDTVVTESTSPSGVAPAPVCPAGTVAVRVKVTQGATVLQDASISTAALSNYADYLGNPDGWQAVPQPDGSCRLEPPIDRTLSFIPLSQSVCAEPGGPGGGTPEPDPVTCGADLVCNAVQGVIGAVKAVKSAVDAVRSAIGSVVKAINDGIAAVKSTIESTVDRIIEAINGVKQAVLDGVIAIGEKLQGLLDQGAGPGPGTGGPTGSGACSGQTVANPTNPVEWVKDGVECALTPDPTKTQEDLTRIRDGIGQPLQGWQDGLGGIAAAWSMSPGSCQGPALVLPLGPPVGSFTLHPLDACSSMMATVASISYLLSTVLLLSAAAWAAAGAIAAGFGYNGGGS